MKIKNYRIKRCRNLNYSIAKIKIIEIEKKLIYCWIKILIQKFLTPPKSLTRLGVGIENKFSYRTCELILWIFSFDCNFILTPFFIPFVPFKPADWALHVGAPLSCKIYEKTSIPKK